MVPSGAAFDFVHVTAAEPWKAAAKGWPLATRCLGVLTGSLGLRGLVVGVDGSSVVSMAGITWRPSLPRAHFLSAIARARFLFVASEADPSPRVLAEALSLDTPLLLNRGILGGWHYLNRRTGVFFEDETDVSAGAMSCLAERSWRCRSWFEAHHGPRRSGTRLGRLLGRLDPGLNGIAPLLLEGADVELAPR
jgi:hypothetical protein